MGKIKYWWVNHRQTFRQEIDGGYLWSPKREKNGARSQFYDNMRLASPGDIVFSFAHTKISFFGRVLDYAIPCLKPDEFGQTGSTWSQDGWFLPVSWQSLNTRIRPKEHLDILSKILPQKYSPLVLSTGNGSQKAYLAEIDESVFLYLAQKGNIPEGGLIKNNEYSPQTFQEISERLDIETERTVINSQELSATEIALVVKARKGQGVFRTNVFNVERGCRLTGITNPILLIASHIKPWRLCENSYERLDGNNGLLLTPHADLLFDRGLISFDEKGRVMVSSRLDKNDFLRLGFSRHRDKGTSFSAAQRRYLEYHRSEVFIV